MAIISKKNKELYDLGKGDNLIEFDLVNSTASDVTYDLFNTTTLSLVPTSPSGVQLPPSYVSFVTAQVGNPSGIGYNSLSNTVYCITNGINIRVINSTLTSPVTTITTNAGAALTNIVYNNINNSMYVTALNNNNVRRVDCNTNTIIDTIAVGATPNGLCFDSLNNRVYVGNEASNDVSVINCNTNTVIATVAVGNLPIGLAYNSLSNTVYVTNNISNDISIIDCNTNTVISTLNPLANPIRSITYDSLNNRMYIGQGTINAVLVLDCFTDTFISTIPTTSSVSQLLYVSAFNLVYVNLFSGGTIVIDCSTNTIVNTIGGGNIPSGIVYNTIDNYIYVPRKSTFTISLISSLSPPPIPYIGGGSFNYNEFIQDIINNPVGVDRLILVSQQNTTNFNQVLNVVYKDANGIETQNPFIPSLSVGTSQFQSGIGKVDFNSELVLGVNQYFSNFLVKANSTVKVLLIYKQLEKSKLLTDKKGMCGRLEFKCNPLQTYNPTKDDAAFDYFHVIPIKPTNPTIKPFSIKDIVPTKPDIRNDITDTKTSIKPLKVSNIYGGQKDITCGACEWSWNRNESDAHDVYVCHKCGYDNQKIYENEKFRV
jgi:YVTN family beta-propeller protein